MPPEESSGGSEGVAAHPWSTEDGGSIGKHITVAKWKSEVTGKALSLNKLRAQQALGDATSAPRSP
jgi:hypothetical protein